MWCGSSYVRARLNTWLCDATVYNNKERKTKRVHEANWEPLTISLRWSLRLLKIKAVDGDGAAVYLGNVPPVLAGGTLGTRPSALAAVASFKADGEGADGRALWWLLAGDTALT